MDNVVSRGSIKMSVRKALKEVARAAKAEHKCIVDGCGRLTTTTVPIYSYDLEVPVCTLHRDYLRELDMTIVSERVYGRQEDVFPAASAYASVFPEARFDNDGTPNMNIPPEQAAMAAYSAAYLMTYELREAGIVAVVEYTTDEPKLVWVDPWFIIPYDPSLEELITGERVTAAEGAPTMSYAEWVQLLGDPSEVIEVVDNSDFSLKEEVGEEDNSEEEDDE